MFLRTKKSVFFYCCLSVLLIVGVLLVARRATRPGSTITALALQ